LPVFIKYQISILTLLATPERIRCGLIFFALPARSGLFRIMITTRDYNIEISSAEDGKGSRRRIGRDGQNFKKYREELGDAI
jgi:hypothetical protein